MEERPREKLLSRGAQALSDGELLAILLRSGQRGESAIELGQRLLALTDGRLTGLFDCDAQYLAGMKGVGTARAATLLAAFELSYVLMKRGVEKLPAQTEDAKARTEALLEENSGLEEEISGYDDYDQIKESKESWERLRTKIEQSESATE